MKLSTQLIVKKNGFTLVETLVAIAVLLLVIIGPMTVAQKGIQNAYYANEQVTAMFLAQEAIEAVRALRDEQALSAFKVVGGTTGGWAPNCTSGCKYSNSNGEASFTSCSGTQCKLTYNSSTGKYSHNLADGVSPFSRTVTVTTPDGGVSYSVVVDVTWTNKIFGNVTRSTKLQTWIYDQYKRYEI